MLGDNSMILGHRLSELCGHGPSLETDIALTNISLDLFGQVRSYFQYAAELSGDGVTEDDLAFLRKDREYRHVVLVEQPNTDFAYTIVRQFLFDSYHYLLLNELMNSKDLTIQAIAKKSIKEVKYHLRFSTDWVKRLGDGTKESHDRLQKALNDLFPLFGELFKESAVEQSMKDQGIGADLKKLEQRCLDQVEEIITISTLSLPDQPFRMTLGKQGIHSEHLGHILSDLQYMQRAYPNQQW